MLHHLPALSMFVMSLAALVGLAISPAAGGMLERLRELLAQLAPQLRTWRFRMEHDAPHGYRPEMDDSGWELKHLGNRWIGEYENAWYRQSVTVPEKVAGFAISGTPVVFTCSIRYDGEIYVGGKLAQRFLNTDGRVVLTETARPGEVLPIAIRDINTFMRGGLFDAHLHYPALDEIADAVIPVANAFEAAAALMTEADADAWNAPLERAARAIDLSAAARGDRRTFIRSLAAASAELGALNDLARRHSVCAVGQSHIDIAWLWRWPETVQVCRDTFRSALDIMRDYPEFIFAQSQAQCYQWMEEHAPDIFEEVRQRVTEGRWEIVGGQWVEPDCNLPSGESLVRQTVYGKRYFREKFGVDVKLGWNPDSFGYAWSMPQIYKKCGIEAFITTKIGWNDTTTFPHHAFWWEGPDGSRILCYFPMSGLDGPWTGGGLQALPMVRDLAGFQRETGLPFTLKLYGVGDHGGGPTRANLDDGRRAQAGPGFPRVEHVRAHDFVARLAAAREHPVWKDELYLEYHRGTFTTHGETKRNNRSAEVLLHDVELFSSWASLLGKPYPKARLSEMWRLAMFNQFHDILPGTSITEAYVDAAADYRRLFRGGRGALEAALKTIAGAVDTRGDGRPVIVFNSLSWPRDGVVEVAVTPDEARRGVTVRDAAGREVPSQIGAGRKLIIAAARVPAMGYVVYHISARPVEKVARPGVAARGTKLENRFLRVEIDPATGWLKSVYDKRAKREVLAGAGNELQVFHDALNAWEVPWNFWERPVALDEGCDIEVVESGPVRAIIRVTRRLGASAFVQDITLAANSPRLDVRVRVDWRSRFKLVKVAFPVSVHPDRATYEIPYAAITRSTRRDTPAEKAKFEVPAQMWADLSQRGYGVSLLNDCKYGYDIAGNVMRLTLLRSPAAPDQVADLGKHEFTYALCPHQGDWRDGGTVQAAHELNYPLHARATTAHVGQLPPTGTLLSAAPENIVLQVVKRAEDGADCILRWYEAAGKATAATITLPRTPKQVWETDLMENDIKELPVTGQTLRVATGKFEIKTVKVKF